MTPDNTGAWYKATIWVPYDTIQFSAILQGQLLLTWINFNLSMDHMISKVLGEINYPFPNFNGCTVEVWEWISNFIPHFIMEAIAYKDTQILDIVLMKSRSLDLRMC